MNNNVCCEAKVEKPMCVADYEHETRKICLRLEQYYQLFIAPLHPTTIVAVM